MAGGRKLMVEVIAAKGLMPKDGEGSANAYCVVRHLVLYLGHSIEFPAVRMD